MKKTIILLSIFVVGLAVSVAHADTKVGVGAIAGFTPGISIVAGTPHLAPTAPTAYPSLKISSDNFSLDIGFNTTLMSSPDISDTNTFALILLKPVYKFSTEKFSPHVGGLIGIASDSNWGNDATTVMLIGITTGASYWLSPNFEVVADYAPVTYSTFKQGSMELTHIGIGQAAISAYWYM